MRIYKFLKDQTGATAVEFALIAPIFFLLIFGIIETGRAYWQTDLIRQASYSGARCAAIADLQCSTVAGTRDVIVARAKASNYNLSPDNIIVEINTNCDGLNSMVRVAINVPFSNAVSGFLPSSLQNLTSDTCMPLMTT